MFAACVCNLHTIRCVFVWRHDCMFIRQLRSESYFGPCQLCVAFCFLWLSFWSLLLPPRVSKPLRSASAGSSRTRHALAHSKPVHQLRAANHRVRRYVHRKLATLTKPKPRNKPKVLRARVHRRPKTREEMLRSFNLACGGELPEGSTPPQLLKGEDLPPFPPARPDIALDRGDDDVPMIATNELPLTAADGWISSERRWAG